MNNEIDYYKNEFWGEIAKYCMDEDYIWFYDEISGGLYRLSKKSYIVEIILTPKEIHKEEIFPVRQILKWKNNIYLIPNNISHEWIVFNIEDKQLRRVLISSQSYEIGNAVSIGDWIYLIPEKTNHILTILESGTLNIKTSIAHWYKNDIKELECWGYSIFEDVIVFPIIGTKEIVQIQGEQVIELSVDIKQSIYSISLSKNGIWILPSKGNVIFFVGRNGRVVDSFEICTDYNKNSAEEFGRIIATDKYVYLLPKQGGQVCILEINSNEWSVIGEKNKPPYRSLYQKTRKFSFWGYYYNEGKLYALPLQYRFAEINKENKSINYKVLQWADLHMNQQYISWIYWINKREKRDFYVEWEKNSLKNFGKIILRETAVLEKSFIGKNIWIMIN